MQIRISELTKRYGTTALPALDSLSLEIDRGTFGLLGPNGAGKTTLIRILSTQLLPTRGQVTIDGLDLHRDRAEVRKRLGYLPQDFGAYPSLSAWEFLDYVGRLAGLHRKSERRDRVEQALEDVRLTADRDRRTGTFSGGMLRRLGIAQAILSDPEFLIVDEPTVGLDPEERLRFRSLLGRLSRDRAILISTHIVGDVSSSCEEIGILDHGRLRFLGPPEDLVGVAEDKAWRIMVDDAGFVEISKQFHVVAVVPEGDMLSLRMVGEGTPPAAAQPVVPNLEDAYVYFIETVGQDRLQ